MRQCYADIVLTELARTGIITTYRMSNLHVDPHNKSARMLRPGAVIEDIREGTKKRPRFDVKMRPSGHAGMAVYTVSDYEQSRIRKYLSVSTHSKQK